MTRFTRINVNEEDKVSQDHIAKVLEAAGHREAAAIVAAMGDANAEPPAHPEVEQAPPAPQYATQAEADGHALLEGLRAAGMLDNYTPLHEGDAR